MRVIRPTRAKTRALRVLRDQGPHPPRGPILRRFQRGEVMRHHLVPREAPVGGPKRPDGMWFRPDDSYLTIDVDWTFCDLWTWPSEGSRHHGYTSVSAAIARCW